MVEPEVKSSWREELPLLLGSNWLLMKEVSFVATEKSLLPGHGTLDCLPKERICEYKNMSLKTFNTDI